MTGEWLAYCRLARFRRSRTFSAGWDIPFQQVTGMLNDDPACWQELEQWLRAAEVVHALAHSRLGLMGHYYGGMLDIATDLTQVSGRFDLHIEMLEVDELAALRIQVGEADARGKLVEFRNFFEVGDDCAQHELLRAARTAVALDQLVSEKDLDLLAYFYSGTGVTRK